MAVRTVSKSPSGSPLSAAPQDFVIGRFIFVVSETDLPCAQRSPSLLFTASATFTDKLDVRKDVNPVDLEPAVRSG